MEKLRVPKGRQPLDASKVRGCVQFPAIRSAEEENESVPRDDNKFPIERARRVQRSRRVAKSPGVRSVVKFPRALTM